MIDVSIVNVALPTIRTGLQASGAGIQLIVAGYMITYAVSLIPGARLGERFGSTRLFMVGLAVFTLASLACGLAGSAGQLIAFRLVQGVGAGAMIPQVMNLIQRMFEGRARSRALGLYTGVIVLGLVLGQVLGGVLVSIDVAGIGWRSIFLINVPVGAVLLLVATRVLPPARQTGGRGLDPAGIAACALAVLALIVPIVLGRELGWPSWCQISLALFPVFAAAFIAIERHGSKTNGSPLVPAALLRVPGLMIGLVTLLFVMAGSAAYQFVFTLYLQSTLGASPLETGLLFIPQAAGSALSSVLWPRFVTRGRRWLVTIGMIGAAGAYLLQLPLLSVQSADGLALLPLTCNLLATGVLAGLGYSASMALTIDRVPKERAANASGAVITVVQLAQALGVALIGTLYLHAVTKGASAEQKLAPALYAIGAAALLAALIGLFLPADVAQLPARATQPE